MSIFLNRSKKKSILNSFIYRVAHLPLASYEFRFKLFLNLEWIFNRLSHEFSYLCFNADTHPIRLSGQSFLLSKILPEHNVLDLGCNQGDISYLLSKNCQRVVGIDIDKNVIDIANQKHKNHNLSFLCEDLYDYLSKKSEPFDVLILSHIIEHLDNPIDFLKKNKNYFKLIYVEVPDFDNVYLNKYREKFNLNLIYSDNDHVVEYTREDLMDIFKSIKLDIVSSEYRYGVQKYWCKVITD